MAQRKLISFVRDLKKTILRSRYQAVRLVNRELIMLYWQVGNMLSERIEKEGWGSKVIEQIAKNLQRELPGLRGFSNSNLKNMRQFYYAYQVLPISQLLTGQLETGAKSAIGQLATGQLAEQEIGPSPTVQLTPTSGTQMTMEEFTALVLATGYTHHMLILNKCTEYEEIIFYLQQNYLHHWTVELLRHHLDTKLHKKRGKMHSNFSKALPEKMSHQAMDVFRDEYLLDFININPDDSERELESEIVRNVRRFILALGKGFTFIGSQHRLEVDDDEFSVDLLFYNRPLRALVAIDLKTGKFKPEYAGKMNFYLSALDDIERLDGENPSIGIILCKEKKRTVVEYAFRDLRKPMGVATYKFSREVPARLRKYLPKPDALKKILK